MIISDITEEVKRQEEMRNRIDFPIDIQKVQTSDGLIINQKAIVRTDTNQVLGVVGNDYEFIRHEEVLQNMEKNLPTELTCRQITMCKDGAVMFAHYETPKIKGVDIKLNDIVSFGLEVFNSYDGSMPMGFQFVAKRLVCLNGMTIPRSIAHIAVRHTSFYNLGKINTEFNRKLPLLQQSVDKWRDWSKLTPKKSRVDSFLKTHVREQLRKRFETEYATGEDKTVWRLFNILTAYNTHEIKVRTENAQNKRLSQLNFEKEVIFPFYAQNWN